MTLAKPTLKRTEVRTPWLDGDWSALLELAEPDLETLPERGRVAAFLAAAHGQLGHQEQAHRLARQARDWGCPRREVARILCSSAHRTLGRVACLLDEDEMATQLFEAAAQMGLARMSLSGDLGGRVARTEGATPFVIVVAGVPRSGSTWLFNALRHTCLAAGMQTYATWCADYDPAQHSDADIHIVKLHSAEDLTFAYHRILTSRRDLVERLGSVMRMGWLKQDAQSIRNAARRHAGLAAYWRGRTDYELAFEDIRQRPEQVIAEMAQVIEVPCSVQDAAQIVQELEAMKKPQKLDEKHDHDVKTLLHPNHRAKTTERAQFVEIVKAALNGSDEV